MASHTIQISDVENPGPGTPKYFPFPEATLDSEETYVLTLEVTQGSPVQFSGVGVALETTWDDYLPLSQEYFDPYGGIYRQFNLELFEPDTEEKLNLIVDVLDGADYLVISSDRVYDAVPHLPLRFPLTVAFYQALFDCDAIVIAECAYPASAPLEGKLGFELVATFESYPSLGGISFPDSTAQESFTVYDHPKVFVFQKTPAFSRDHVRALLEAVDLKQVIEQSAAQVTAAPDALRIPADRLATQKNEGTWSEIFSPTSALNRSQTLGTLVWYFLLLIFGWFAFPITFLAFRGLSDRGYGISRVVGLLLVGWVTWFGSSYMLFPFTRLVLWLALGLLGILGAGIVWKKSDSILSFIKEKWKHILTLEGLFLVLFLFALVLRWYNPDLWHPWRGGEKPGDLAMFHAVLKTVYFPLYDPWMAGNILHYFYFGYVLAAVPTKILGILPEIAYNLLIPTWFGLTGLGLFSVAYNLVAVQIETGKEAIAKTKRQALPYLAGSVALVVGLFLGNFAQVKILWEQLPRFAPDRITEPILPAQAADALAGLEQVLTGEEDLLQGDMGVWYFDATRAIQSGEEVAPITEFPYFSFLYADLHPHLLGMPIMLCGLAWLVSVLYSPPKISKQSLRKDWGSLIIVWLIGGLVVGATYLTNTWDFPAILVLGVFAIGFAFWENSEKGLRQTILEICLYLGLLYILAVGLFTPFRQWFSTGDLAPKLWPGPRTPLVDYFTVHGLFLFIILTFLLIETIRWLRPAIDYVIHTPLGKLVPGLWFGLAALVSIILAVIFGGGWLWRNGYQTAGFVLISGLWTGGLLLWKNLSLNRRVALILVGAGFGLSLLAELLEISGDIGRMNVVFKSYLLVWFFFSIAVGAIFSFAWPEIRGWKRRWAWYGILGLLVLAAGVYPVIGTLARIKDRWPDVQNPPLTLNGMAFMNGDSESGSAVYYEQELPLFLAEDYQVFLWIRENVRGTPTIVEGHTGEYRWGARYSVYTGLPTVVGWSWHLRQHNVVLPASAIEKRIEAVNDFYNTTDLLEAQNFLERYNVDLIVVGEMEWAIYSEDGILKFEQMVEDGYLEIVYPEDGELSILNIFAVP